MKKPVTHADSSLNPHPKGGAASARTVTSRLGQAAQRTSGADGSLPR
jgi:hypothetical protein